MADAFRLFLDQRQGRLNVAMRDREVADIGDVEQRRLTSVQGMFAVDQHPAGLTDRRGAEARAGPVRGAQIIGNAGNADRRVAVTALDAEEARTYGKGG